VPRGSQRMLCMASTHEETPMSLIAAFFYLFATLTIASSVMVIAARNPVHAVLYLILAFVNASGLFMLAGAEFLAMVLIVVYVGAVAVLFLFVVMMLDVDFVELRQGFLEYLPIGGLIGGIVLFELTLVLGAWVIAPEALDRAAKTGVLAAENISNTEALGQVIYTRFIYAFQGAGLILLLAMIGAIVLTLRNREGVKRQDISAQVARTRESGMEVVSVKSGRGLEG
jgi:NADH-quinone oxidoreductase subunit J